MNTDAREMVTTAQAARLLGLTRHSVQSAVKRGRMHGEKRGGRWFITIAEVERYRAFHRHEQASDRVTGGDPSGSAQRSAET